MSTHEFEAVVVGCGIAELSAGDLSGRAQRLSRDPREITQEAPWRPHSVPESFCLPTADIDLAIEFNVRDYTAADFLLRSDDLDAGEYGFSKEKRTRYFGPGYGKMKIRGSRFNTGEVIDSAMDIGTKFEGEWGDTHMAILDVGSPDIERGITRIDGYRYGVILNHGGERFVH